MRRVSLQSCQTTTRPFALLLSFPMETITHGLRRMLTPPARAAHHRGLQRAEVGMLERKALQLHLSRVLTAVSFANKMLTKRDSCFIC